MVLSDRQNTYATTSPTNATSSSRITLSFVLAYRPSRHGADRDDAGAGGNLKSLVIQDVAAVVICNLCGPNGLCNMHANQTFETRVQRRRNGIATRGVETDITRQTEPSMSNFSHFCAYGMLSEPPSFSMATLSLRVRRAAGKLGHMMRRFFGAVKPVGPALPTSGC
jgi:hypothetical protein